MLGVSDSSYSNAAALGDGSVSSDGTTATSNVDGSLTVTSAGGDVVATHSDPLPVVAIPVAVMPDAVEVAVVLPTQNTATSPEIWSAGIASAGSWTAQKVELGRAIIDIDSMYRLSINDIMAEVLLENRHTNVVTRIWGDAQVSVNGQDVGQFWGTSSFQLANGTLITANTVVSPDNASAYMLDKLVVTRDEYGFVVTGISSGTLGDVDIALAANATVYDHVPPAPTQTPAPVTETAPTPSSAAPVETVTEAPTPQPALPKEAAQKEAIVAQKPMPSQVETSPANVEAPALAAETPINVVPAETAPVEAAPTAAAPAETSPSETAPAAVATPILVENKEAVIAAIKAKVDAYDMDDDQRDGLVFLETATGWIDEWDDQAISAAVLAQTMPGGDFGPNSDIMSRSEFSTVINRFISIMTTQSFMSNISMRNTEFQSQLRDTSADQDRTAASKQAEQRAARERMIMIGLMEAGSVAADMLDRYRGTEQPVAHEG